MLSTLLTFILGGGMRPEPRRGSAAAPPRRSRGAETGPRRERSGAGRARRGGAEWSGAPPRRQRHHPRHQRRRGAGRRARGRRLSLCPVRPGSLPSPYTEEEAEERSTPGSWVYRGECPERAREDRPAASHRWLCITC